MEVEIKPGLQFTLVDFPKDIFTITAIENGEVQVEPHNPFMSVPVSVAQQYIEYHDWVLVNPDV